MPGSWRYTTRSSRRRDKKTCEAGSLTTSPGWTTIDAPSASYFQSRRPDSNRRDTVGIEDGVAVLMEAESGAVRVCALAVEGERALALADGAALLEEEAVAAEPLDEPAGGIGNAVGGQGVDGEGTAQGAREMHRAVGERPEVDDAALDQG